MKQSKDPAMPAGQSDSQHLLDWLEDFGPLILVIGGLCLKMVHLGLSLRMTWWAPQESTVEWIWGHPQIVTAALGAPLILLGPSAALSRIPRYLFALAVELIITTLLVVDLVHSDYYGDLPSLKSVTSVAMMWVTLPTVARLLHPNQLFYYLDVILLIVGLPFYIRASQRRPAAPTHSTRRISIGLSVCGLLLMLPTARVLVRDSEALLATGTLQRDVCAALGLLPYHALDAFVHLSRPVIPVTDADREAVVSYLARRRAQRPPHLASFGAARGKNLIVVLAESLQGFPLDLRIRDQQITPNLDALSLESMYFTNLSEQTHLGTTADAEFILMQSLHPTAVGAVADRYRANHYRALPHVLAARGYSTMAAVGETETIWRMDLMHPALGFQRSYFEPDFTVEERIAGWMTDRNFLEQSVPLLQQQPEPFMAYLLTSSNHSPWDLPPHLRTLALGDLDNTVLGNYLQSVHYFDQALGAFVEQLRRSALLDRSVLVVVGDHQAFLTPEDLGSLLGFSPDRKDQYLLMRKRVPLLVRLPGKALAGRRTRNGGQIDIAPTLLALLGIEDPQSVMLGQDLTLDSDSLVVFRDGGFADDGHFMVNRLGPIDDAACFETPSGRTISCAGLSERRDAAREQLQVSDTILRGDLTSSLSASSQLTEFGAIK